MMTPEMVRTRALKDRLTNNTEWGRNGMLEAISWSLRQHCDKTFAGLCEVPRPVEGQRFNNYNNVSQAYESEEFQWGYHSFARGTNKIKSILVVLICSSQGVSVHCSRKEWKSYSNPVEQENWGIKYCEQVSCFLAYFPKEITLHSHTVYVVCFPVSTLKKY